jgi:hypothetical protein
LTLQRWHRIALVTSAVIAVFYGMVYADVVLRAREAWQEGEKFWRWADHPEERLVYLKQKQNEEQVALDEKLKQGKIVRDDYDRDKELLEFRYTQMAQESCLKYAYVWYQTAAELFSPPESKWVKLARAKMPLAKARWKAELHAKKIPFEDYMID